MIGELRELKQHYIDVSYAAIPDDLADLREGVAEFVTYPGAERWNVGWCEDNVHFLRTIGLPHSAPSMIEFRTPVEIDLEYVYIGFNSYGDRIAVMKTTGNVVCIDHEAGNHAEYMNQDPISLFRSICAFSELVASQEGFTEKITSIDPKALQEGRWWHQQFIEWTSE